MTRARPFRRAFWRRLAQPLLLASCGLGALPVAAQELAPGALAGTDSAAMAAAAELFATYTWGSISFDTLQTNGLPFKVEAAALLLYYHDQEGLPLTYDSLAQIYPRFGFIYPQAIANWPGADLSQFRAIPLGMVHGMLAPPLTPIRVEIAEQGCAACHAGVLYDKDGMPTKTVYLGVPNTSINIEGFTTAVYTSLKYATERPLALFAAMHQAFPQMAPEEDATIKLLVWPLTAKRIIELAVKLDRATPQINGAPGITNGIGSLKNIYHLIPDNQVWRGDGFTSVPVAGDRQFRSSLLYDGTYTPAGDERFRKMDLAAANDPEHIDKIAGIVSFFTVPVMGTKSSVAESEIPQAQTILRGFAAGWEPPAFPGTIDQNLATQGRSVYTHQCARCHGTYAQRNGRWRLASFPNKAVPLSEIGTDPLRGQSISPDLITALQNDDAYMRHIDVANTGVYVATPLTALWLSAPYLHNGSVPTLWHLMHPSERPRAFWVGGHKQDFTKVGIAGELSASGIYNYPLNYVPWSTPELYDTHVAGQGNGGHEFPFDHMSETDKQALIEFLKLI